MQQLNNSFQPTSQYSPMNSAVKGQSQSVKELMAMVNNMFPEDKPANLFGAENPGRSPLGTMPNGFKSLNATGVGKLGTPPAKPGVALGFPHPAPPRTPSGTPQKNDQLGNQQQQLGGNRGAVVPAYRETVRTNPSMPGRISPNSLMELCMAFVNSLHLPSVYFDSTYNEFFVDEVYGANSPDWSIAGGRKYTIPRNWVRFGLFVDPVRAKVDSIWENWCVSFHGTNEKVLPSVLYHRQLLFPGDALLDGSVLEPNSVRARHVYTSPSIYYSSLFSPPVEFTAPDGRVLHAQMVLQCMQRPSTFQVQAGNSMVTNNPCPYIPFSEIEFTTDAISSVVPYGLLVRICEYVH